jgi:hypothetical protein
VRIVTQYPQRQGIGENAPLVQNLMSGAMLSGC